MGKFYGMVGYAVSKETSPGVWTDAIVERPYYGDVKKLARRLANGEGLNDNVDISNIISIVSDPFGFTNFHAIRYVTWFGSKWKVSSVEVAYPRLELTLGGLYNVQTQS